MNLLFQPHACSNPPLILLSPMQFTLNLMLKHLLSIEPEEPLAVKILEDFLTYMKGFVSLPVYIPGTPYASAVKVLT